MPTNTPPLRSPLRTLAAAAAALLLTVGGLLMASPASAHDELVSTDPTADSALDALPQQLTLTFSGELATDPGATQLKVTDAAGTALADGEPLVEGTVVMQPLRGAASGVVTVLWKVVSSDGHPISGEFAFTVTAPPPATPTPASPSATTPASPSTTSPTDAPTPAPTETTAPADGGAAAWPWVLLSLLGVAVLGAVTYLLVSRANRQKALDAASAASIETGPDGGSAPPTTPPADR